MTGFGAGQARIESEELAVEVRSWNHKFCEVKVRLPRELGALEPGIVKAVKNRIARGSVEVFVRRQGADEALGAPTVDLGLAREYFAALTSLASELRLTGEVRVQDLAAQPGVLRLEERQVVLTRAAEATHSALSEALGKLTQMREAEGEAIEEVLRGRVNALQS